MGLEGGKEDLDDEETEEWGKSCDELCADTTPRFRWAKSRCRRKGRCKDEEEEPPESPAACEARCQKISSTLDRNRCLSKCGESLVGVEGGKEDLDDEETEEWGKTCDEL